MVEYYNDSFFEDLASEESKTCRFRAVVQYVNLAFAEAVQLKGQQINLRSDRLEGKSDKAISQVRQTLTCSRG